MRLTLTALACLAALTFAAPAMAQKYPDDNQKLTNFSMTTLKPVFAPLDGAFSEFKGQSATYGLFETNGLKVAIEFQACGDNPNNCLGALMMAYVSYPKTVSKAAALEAVNSFNMRYSYIKAVWISDGVIGISRYVIADNGISYGTFRAEVDTFTWITREFISKVAPTLK